MAQNDILARIKQIRKEKGLSQAAMAEKLHIALKTYQNIENGVTRIDLERLEQMAGVLETPLTGLFGKTATDGSLEEQLQRFVNEEKDLYHKIIHDKETYILQLEQHIRFYQKMLQENKGI